MYLPSWFPGASVRTCPSTIIDGEVTDLEWQYKKYARDVHHCSVDTRENPWIAAKEALVRQESMILSA